MSKQSLFKRMLAAVLCTLIIAAACSFVAASEDPVKILQYEMEEMVTIEGETNKAVLNSLDPEKYPLLFHYNATVENVSNTTYSFKRYIRPYNGLYNVAWVKGDDFSSKLNGKVSFEGWVNMIDNRGNEIFMVTNQNYVNADDVLMWVRYVLSPDNTTGRFVFGRRFDSSGLMNWISSYVPNVKGSWVHLVVTYDDSSASNIPVFYVNGNELETSVYYGSAVGNASAITDQHVTRWGAPNGSILTTAQLGRQALYKGLLNEAQVIASYNSQRSEYEFAYDIKIKNMSGIMIPQDSLNTVSVNRTTIEIDFTAPASMTTNMDTVNASTVRLINITDNKQVPYTAIKDGFTYIMSGYKLEGNKNYLLTIDNVYNTSGEKIRSSVQELVFFTGLPPAPFVRYDMDKRANLPYPDPDGVLRLHVLNNLDETKYPLYINYDKQGEVTFEKMNNTTYSKEYLRPKLDIYNVTQIMGADFQEDLNGIFTYEGWFNILKPTAGTTLFHVLTPQQRTNGDRGEIYLYTGEMSDSHTNGRLIFGRVFNEKTGLWSVLVENLRDSWNHVVVIYDDSSPSNKPVFYINGVKMEGAVYGGNTPQGTAVPVSSDSHIVALGAINTSKISAAAMGKQAIYGTALPEAVIIENYLMERGLYQPGFDIKLYQNDILVTAEQINSLDGQNLKISIDFMDAEKSSITPETLYICDENTGQQVEYQGSWDDDADSVYSIFFETLPKGSYSINISPSITATGISRTAEQNLYFDVVPSFEVVSLQIYNQDDEVIEDSDDLAVATHVYAKAVLTNRAESPVPVTLLLAVYNTDGQLRTITFNEVENGLSTVVEGEVETTALPLQYGTLKVKAMLISGFDTLTPYTQAVER